ncbi:MAG: DUF3332 family protein [Candidatus Sumerlaeia bacterium]|nr:DUF3332 family protein [Candidatus Sumerlaeia bacterium]
MITAIRARSPWTRALTTLLLVTVLVFAMGCYGSFPLTHAVYNFNGEVTDNSIGQQLVFWVFIILPVYGIAQLGDAIIFNLIEFWTGETLDIGQADLPIDRAVAIAHAPARFVAV